MFYVCRELKKQQMKNRKYWRECLEEILEKENITDELVENIINISETEYEYCSTVVMLINDYQLRLEQTQNLYDTIQEEELRDVILIQLNIYNTILADLEQLQIK